MSLNPFDIYIIIPDDEERGLKIKEIFYKIWSRLSFLPAIFRIQYVRREDFETDDEEDNTYLKKILSKINVLARVLSPNAYSLNFEMGALKINLENIEETEIELFLYLLQLIQSDMSILKQYEYSDRFWRENKEKKALIQLLEIEEAFSHIEDYLKNKLKGRFFERIRPQLSPQESSSHRALRKISMQTISKVQKSEGILEKIEGMALKLGLNIPNEKVDPNIKIEICENVDGSIYPGIIIQNKHDIVISLAGFKEGIFLYICALLYKIEDKEFNKKYFIEFLNKLYNYKEGENIRTDKLPPELKESYNWYEAVYNALFQRVRVSYQYEEIYYRGGIDFEKWCVELLKKTNKSNGNKRIFLSHADPLRQGIGQLRKNLKLSLEQAELEDLYPKINLDPKVGEKERPYKLYIDKKNIFFPDNERWGKIVKDKSHLRKKSIIE